MISLGLESVLIGHPGDRVSLAIFGERVAALRHGSRLFGFGSDLLLDSALADDDSVLPLVAERVHLFLRVVVCDCLTMRMGRLSWGAAAATAKNTAIKIMDFMLKSREAFTGKRSDPH